MTREQQIYKKAEGDCISMLESIERGDIIKGSICPQSYRSGFIDGAKWADSHPHWISVEERLPKINDVADTWDCSDDVCIHLVTGSHCIGRYEHDKSVNEFYWVLYGVDKDIPVTHWMEIVPPRKEE